MYKNIKYAIMVFALTIMQYFHLGIQFLSFTIYLMSRWRKYDYHK